jgi:hypothetical protein
MWSDTEAEARTHVTAVRLALELLYRRRRPWDQQRRIAQLGIMSARRLADVLLTRRGRRSPRVSDGAT